MEQKNQIKQRFNLFTALMFLIGAVIGSGIFFKSDNILVATNGNVLLGVLVFVFGGIAIVFGGLTMAELASRNEEQGGVITYMRVFVGARAGVAFGWFMTFVLFPAVTVILSWVSAIYLCIFLNIEMTLEIQVGLGFVIMILLFLMNLFATKIGELFQNSTTLIKLIPLFMIAIAGFFSGDSSLAVPKTVVTTGGTTALFTAMAAIPAIAFTYDGWVTATMMSSEIKNSKRNFPIVLVVSPLIIMGLYIAYFIGINKLVGPETIMSLGDAHMNLAVTNLLGPVVAKFINLFVLISILGVTNVIVMAVIRAPYSLATQNAMPMSKKINVLSNKYNMPMASGVAAFVLCIAWYVVHYCTTKYNLLPNSDISEIAAVTSYLCYILLYIRVFKMGMKKEIGFFRGKVCPILAIVGSLIIFAGGLQSSLFAGYIIFNLIVMAVGYLYYSRVSKCTS